MNIEIQIVIKPVYAPIEIEVTPSYPSFNPYTTIPSTLPYNGIPYWNLLPSGVCGTFEGFDSSGVSYLV
jgi:hypothetical protein